MHLLTRPGGRIAYEVRGDGPLVVCLPGMGELRATYRHTAPALVAAGYRVATMDLRRHGDSDITFDRYDAVAAGEDALALTAALGGPAVLVGNSMGAGGALVAAATQPDAVAGLALLGPFARDPGTSLFGRLLARAAMAGPWSTAAWVRYLRTLYPTRRPADLDAHLAAVGAAMRRPGYARAFRAVTRVSHAPVTACLPRVHRPTTVVMGTRDPDFADPVAEARWLADAVGAECHLVDGAGHYPHVDSAAQVNALLRDFLGRVTRRG